MPKKAKSSGDKVRLNFLVRQSVKDRLDRLVDKVEAESLTEVVRRSLVIYEILLNLEKNSKIILRSPDGKEKVLILTETIQ